MDKNIVAKMINISPQMSEQDLLKVLSGKILAADKAAGYKAQADFWKEKYDDLQMHCIKAINKKNGLKYLSEAIEEAVDTLMI